MRHASQGLVRLGCLVADRFLKEVQRVAAEFLAERGGFGNGKAVVVVDAKDGPVTDSLAKLVEPVGGRSDAFPRFVDRISVFTLLTGRVHPRADDIPTLRDQQFGILDQFRSHRCAGGGEERNPVSVLASKQLVDGDSKCLPLDVMQSDVDGRYRRRQDTTALEVLASIEVLPDGTDVEGVSSDDEFAIMSQCSHHRKLSTR